MFYFSKQEVPGIFERYNRWRVDKQQLSKAKKQAKDVKKKQ